MSLARHAESAAKKKLGADLPSTYAACSWDASDKGGAVKVGFAQQGKDSDGQVMWGRKTLRVRISAKEIEAERALFVAETGKCPECLGDCKTTSSWSAAAGWRYRPCSACNGTGEATP